jgi:hypothetical protein
MTVYRYKNNTPKLKLEDFFSGDISVWGMFEDTFGIIRKRFTCKISGNWDKNTKTLNIKENFIYDDGVIEYRDWKLIKKNNNYYEGTTDAVIGKALGYTSGNTFHWKYTFELPLFGRKTRVKFDDWMYLQDNDVIINKAYMKKFGLKLGTVTLFYKKCH